MKKYFVAGLFFIVSMFIYSQGEYTCDFEDSVENAQWTLRSGVHAESCVNKWYIDTAANSGGLKGLYISSDEGRHSKYAKSTTLSVAYRTLTLPAGDYYLSFDWQSGNSQRNGFYACWVPSSLPDPIVSNTTGIKGDWVELYAINSSDTSLMFAKSKWRASYDTITSDGTAHKLVFVWVNTQGFANPSACIDNVEIFPLNSCEQPSQLAAIIPDNTTDLMMTWSCVADSFDLRYHTGQKGEWHYNTGLTSSVFTSLDIEEGPLYAFVRAYCGGKRSVWISLEQFLFFKGVRCVDYLDLNARNCYYGVNKKPRENRGVVDYGSYSIQSRHTIHYDPDEYDPNTGGELPTVYPGELATVRLGNWGIGAECEMIEYDYVVDAKTNPLFLLRYAVVLQEPLKYHVPENMPMFTLEILKEGRPISKLGCGEAHFIPGQNTEGWNTFLPDGDTVPVMYSEWETVGINLQEHDGASLTIRLTTYDCLQTGHYGYAYFSIGCTNGRIDGQGCGTQIVDSLTAPYGFKYRWYEPNNPDSVISTRRSIQVDPNDPKLYYCDVIQPTNVICYFTLEASGVPRSANPQFDYTVETRDCQNIVTFVNKTNVIRVNSVSKDTTITTEDVDSWIWDFGDGTTSTELNPTHTFPCDGQPHTVTLSATITGTGGVTCDNSLQVLLDMPDVSNVVDSLKVNLCQGESYEYKGRTYYSSVIVADTILDTVTGCSTIEVLDLNIAAPAESELKDTICSGNLPYIIGEQTITAAGDHDVTVKTADGCDSIIHLHLLVLESLEVGLPLETDVCADDSQVLIPYSVASGTLTTYQVSSPSVSAFTVDTLRPADGVLQFPFPEGIAPGDYPLTLAFHNADCGRFDHDMTLKVRYPRPVVTQRWNDVLSITNRNTHGGDYDFVACQWYRDGEPISGATGFNLYVEEGLASASEYSALLTSTTGSMIFTCAHSPVDNSSAVDEPTVTFADGNIQVSNIPSAAQVEIWNAAGMLMMRFSIEADQIESVDLPQGVYLVRVVSADGFVSTEKIVVDNR